MRHVIVAFVVVLGLCGGGCKKKKPRAGDGGVAAIDAGVARPKEFARPADRIVDPQVFDRARIAAIDKLAFEHITRIRPMCIFPPPTPESAIDVDRALFVHDRATLDGADFSLKRTLEQLAAQAVVGGGDPSATTADNLFRDLWDTQNAATAAAAPDGAHCDDDGTTLNGFPNDCPRAEGDQAKASPLSGEVAKYRAIALVNRIDLAAEGWRNCGEHRIIYGRNDGRRNFIIFEAVLPNPRPGCQSGCRPVAAQWQSLSAEADPVKRALALEKLFYKGLPGFAPVVHLNHYAATAPSGGYGAGGSGQIRTNQFLQGPWLLREFKLALDCSSAPCVLDTVPLPVAVNPHGELWSESTVGLANDFQQNVVRPAVTAAGLGGPVDTFSYQVPGVFNSGRSDPQSGKIFDHYFEAYTSTAGVALGFRSQLAAAAPAVSAGLTDTHVVNRALALSCAGCHQPGAFGLTTTGSIGPGLSFPNSAGFVHVVENDSAGVHLLSDALVKSFLPARRKNLAALLDAPICLCRPRRPPFDIRRFEERVLPRPPLKIDDLRTAESRLIRELNAELTRTGQQPLPTLADAAQVKVSPLVLDSVKAAGTDPVRRRTALRAAVQKLVADEPPRKTVTGHFRTH